MKFSPVLVFWRDACFDEGWVDADEIDFEAEAHQQVMSLGFLLREDAKNVHLCMSKTGEDVVADILTIPKNMIISKTFLLEPKNALRKM